MTLRQKALLLVVVALLVVLAVELLVDEDLDSVLRALVG
jgi:hypothetical protein